MKRSGSRPGLLFQLVVPATAMFIVTVLSLIAVLFSDRRAPLAQLLDRHGNRLLMAELVVVMLLAVAAVVVDRRRTPRSAGPAAAVADSTETDGAETHRTETDASASVGSR